MSFLALAAMTPGTKAEIIRPKVRLQLHLAPQDVLELRQLLLRFAASHGLQVEDIGARMPISRVMPPVKGRRPSILELKHRDVTLCVDDFMEAKKFGVFIYELKPGTEARQIASEFEAVLRNRWPDKLKPFADP